MHFTKTNPQDWIASGDRIFVAATSNEPLGLLEALRPAVQAGVEFVQFPLRGLNAMDSSARGPLGSSGYEA